MITLNTLAYSQDSFVSKDKVSYTGPSNTFNTKDLLILGRVAPKPTATFAGVARASVKRVKTVTLADGTKADAIVELNASLPVGMTEADVNALRDDVGDFAISADANSLLWKHDLTF